MKGVSTSPLSQRGRALRDCNCVGAKFVILTKQCRAHCTQLRGEEELFPLGSAANWIDIRHDRIITSFAQWTQGWPISSYSTLKWRQSHLRKIMKNQFPKWIASECKWMCQILLWSLRSKLFQFSGSFVIFQLHVHNVYIILCTYIILVCKCLV